MTTDDYTWLILGVILVGCVVGGFSLSAFIIMMLWNVVLVPLFHIQLITFWQSLGIAICLSFVGNFFKP